MRTDFSPLLPFAMNRNNAMTILCRWSPLTLALAVLVLIKNDPRNYTKWHETVFVFVGVTSRIVFINPILKPSD